MRGYRRALNPILATLMVVAFVLPTAFARVAVAWFCEGRVCGATPLYCCCDSPSGSQDTRCTTGSAQTRDNKAAELCAAGCNCQKVFTASPDLPAASRTTTPATVYPTLVALPPSVLPLVPTPELRRVVLGPIVPRGPPVTAADFVVPSLRAPPFHG